MSAYADTSCCWARHHSIVSFDPILLFKQISALKAGAQKPVSWIWYYLRNSSRTRSDSLPLPLSPASRQTLGELLFLSSRTSTCSQTTLLSFSSLAPSELIKTGQLSTLGCSLSGVLNWPYMSSYSVCDNLQCHGRTITRKSTHTREYGTIDRYGADRAVWSLSELPSIFGVQMRYPPDRFL